MLHMWHISNFRDGPIGRSDAANAAAAARDAQTTAADLEERLDKLTLITMAMWEMLRDNTKFTETDLMAKVQELDLRDGTPDGKMTRTVSKCPQCNRSMSPRHKKCLYCGHESLVHSAFDGI
jgi:ribosomal protein S27AE